MGSPGTVKRLGARRSCSHVRTLVLARLMEERPSCKRGAPLSNLEDQCREDASAIVAHVALDVNRPNRAKRPSFQGASLAAERGPEALREVDEASDRSP